MKLQSLLKTYSYLFPLKRPGNEALSGKTYHF